MELDKKTINKIIMVFIGLAIFYFTVNYWKGITGILQYIYGLFFPFILGGCIAFVINIPMNIFKNALSKVKGKRIGRLIRKVDSVISLVLSCILILGIIVFSLYIVIPQIIETIKILPDTFQSSTLALQKWIDNKGWIPSSNVTDLINSMQINWNGIIENVKSVVFKGAGSMVVTTIGVATTFANGVFELILGFVFAIYILLKKKSLGIQFRKVLYAFFKTERADSILEIIALTSQTFSNFVSGQCLESAILGIMFFITMLIFNFPYAVVASVIIGITSFVPVLGSIVGCVLVEFLIVMVNPSKAVLFLIVYIVIKQLEDNLIYPRIVGNSVGLPSIWVLLVITLGGKLMGIAGMIISIPLFSVAYVLFRKEIYRKLKKKGIEIV